MFHTLSLLPCVLRFFQILQNLQKKRTERRGRLSSEVDKSKYSKSNLIFKVTSGLASHSLFLSAHDRSVALSFRRLRHLLLYLLDYLLRFRAPNSCFFRFTLFRCFVLVLFPFLQLFRSSLLLLYCYIGVVLLSLNIRCCLFSCICPDQSDFANMLYIFVVVVVANSGWFRCFFYPP